MFTGLVIGCGEIIAQHMQEDNMRLVLKAQINKPILGESIAVNGVCLTLVEANNTEIAFDTLRAITTCLI